MKRQTKFLLVCLMLLLLTISACAPTLVQQPTVTTTSSPTPVIPPTATPVPPTSTLAPTQTPSPTPTPVATPVPPSETWSSQSPDGQWSAQGWLAGPFPAADGSEQYQTRLEVINTAGTVQWTLVDQTLNYGLGYTTPRPFHWSADGRYVYFTNLAVADGCSLFHNGSDLYRADLSNGQITELISPWTWWISLSPDEQTAAYILWNGEALLLRILDLATRDYSEMMLEGNYTQAGSIVWSPDGQALMLTLAANPCLPEWTQAIVRVEVASLSPTILIRDDERLFVTTEWPEADRVLLTDQKGNSWLMEATTGRVEKAP